MPVSDRKRAQTLINIAADAAEELQDIAARLEAVRTAYVDGEVDPTGTPLAGNVTAVSNWIDAVSAAAESAVATAMIAAKVPTHRGEAL